MKGRCDAMSIERLHRFLSVLCLKTPGFCSERADVSDRRVAALGEVQPFRRLIFHRCAECLTLDVTGQYGTIKDGYAYPGCDQEKTSNRRRIDQQFSSHDGEVTRLNRYIVTNHSALFLI